MIEVRPSTDLKSMFDIFGDSISQQSYATWWPVYGDI